MTVDSTASLLKSVLSCPNCGHKKEESVPLDSCLFFYECESCKSILTPQPGDCCVFCSYGTVKCPSHDSNETTQPGCCA
ncbi:MULTISPECIES: GDCCVxC domain-containing (seleno)protein [unclassified Mucilaginibacter]|uniref:GDCCVxC domain-containing (seleno)protein n=1 Tax=unclassified Mucilaginibacter TaxID=2617802 RepID=UPI002AC9CFFB|nr:MULTISPECIES: GDCCVxC domain-containing (seleno)protein [unclassified Mucilaginibacter]MEB0260293.1 GDCCVxC domain-containing (seleno)protein [Mucilaginibacter sp. 10I4]MEB0277296.1 GDCCVxC domain-containing (seleno)protein [Mucilaginibacter sp. 10B2]MEB0302147.1 GDCCVxC domain-containing (seleno)protein [Mucilaginibacter sp. 5C4]WPX25423.1 GDCCVxC domain-containing (seleno)protein [Mucilaginibacter sp. 5C4]